MVTFYLASRLKLGPAAPLTFSLFSSPAFYLLGGTFWGFDWIPASWGLLHPSYQGPGPTPPPIIAPCHLSDRVRPCLYSKGHLVHIP